MAIGRRVIWVLCWLAPFAAQGQQRPLLTEEAYILPTGRVQAELGAEILQGQKFSLSGLDGTLVQAGVASVHVGVGDYAEFEISGVARDLYWVSSRTAPVIPPKFTGDFTTDFGDLILATKLRLAGEGRSRPAISFRFSVELPNAKHDSGLGTDQTEFYSDLLMTKRIGRAEILGDLGFAILGSPVLLGRQCDSLTYGAGAIWPLTRRVNLAVGVSGRQGPPDRVGNENKSQARAGLQIRTGAVRWDVGGVAGLMPYDPRAGAIVGMTYEFRAFKRN